MLSTRRPIAMRLPLRRRALLSPLEIEPRNREISSYQGCPGHPAAGVWFVESSGAGRARSLPDLRLRRNPSADFRADGAFRAFGGTRYRYRLEGDVFIRGSRRFFHQLAAGGDGFGGARLYRAWDAHAAGEREALLHRADVSPRAPAEGALP